MRRSKDGATDDMTTTRRSLILVARLKPGALAAAKALATESSLFEPSEPGVTRETMYLSPSELVVVVEADHDEQGMRNWIDDPEASTPLHDWLTLVDGPLHEVG